MVDSEARYASQNTADHEANWPRKFASYRPKSGTPGDAHACSTYGGIFKRKVTSYPNRQSCSHRATKPSLLTFRADFRTANRYASWFTFCITSAFELYFGYGFT